MTLEDKVKEKALLMQGEFTMYEFIQKLIEEEVFTDWNKERVLSAIDECLERGIIKQVAHTNRYCV